MRATSHALSFVVLAAFVGGTTSVAYLASDPVHERHEAMEEVGAGMKALAGVAKKETPFDAAMVTKHAGEMAANLEKASKLFPAGSAGESRAKPEIWSDAAGFEKAMKDGIAAAKAVQAVKDEAAFGTAFRAMGASCKSCHDKYRAPRK